MHSMTTPRPPCFRSNCAAGSRTRWSGRGSCPTSSSASGTCIGMVGWRPVSDLNATPPHITTDRRPRLTGCTTTSDADPGIARRRAGRGFSTAAWMRRPVAAPVRRWIEGLAIPPAWRDVWISADPDGHLLATGRDARGRKQYRYHEAYRSRKDAAKFDRLGAFGRSLPRLRRQVAADLGLPGLARDKVLGAMVALLEETSIRVGNEDYTRENRILRLDHAPVASRDGERRARPLPYRGRSSDSIASAYTTGGWRGSSAAARSSPGNDCSSTRTRRATGASSRPTTSTTTSGPRPAATSRPRLPDVGRDLGRLHDARGQHRERRGGRRRDWRRRWPARGETSRDRRRRGGGRSLGNTPAVAVGRMSIRGSKRRSITMPSRRRSGPLGPAGARPANPN